MKQHHTVPVSNYFRSKTRNSSLSFWCLIPATLKYFKADVALWKEKKSIGIPRGDHFKSCGHCLVQRALNVCAQCLLHIYHNPEILMSLHCGQDGCIVLCCLVGMVQKYST